MVGRYVDFIHKLCEHRNFVRERVIRVVRLSSSLSLLGVEMASERWSLIQFTKCSSGLLLDIPAQCCETELSPAFKNGMFCFVLFCALVLLGEIHFNPEQRREIERGKHVEKRISGVGNFVQLLFRGAGDKKLLTYFAMQSCFYQRAV